MELGREAAKQMFRDDKNSQGCYRSVMTKIDKIYDAFEAQEQVNVSLGSVIKSLEVPEIRNKLSPITHLLWLISSDQPEDMILKALPKAKESVNYLAQREVYS